MDRTDYDQKSVTSTNPIRRWLALLLAALPLSVAAALSIFIFFKGSAGFQIEKTQFCFVVSKVNSPLNPVRAGDCITHIGGLKYHKVLGCLLSTQRPIVPIDRITLRRGNRTITTTLAYAPLGALQFIQSTWPYWMFALLSLILCLSVLRLAPAGQPTGLFILSLSSFTLLLVCQFPIQFGILHPELQSAASLITTLANWIGFSAWLHFTIRFPLDRQLWRDSPRRVAFIVYCIPPAVALGLSLILSDGSVDFFGWVQRLRRWAVPLIIATILTKQWTDLRAATSVVTRNQLRLMLTGSAIGVSVYLFLYLVPSLAVDRPLVPFYVAALCAVLIPISLFLALVRYRLLDVDRMIGWIVSHMLLVGVLFAAYTGGLYGLKHLLWGQGLASEEFFFLLLVLIALFFSPVRDRLQHAIDVLFFRQKINYRQVLHDFSGKVVAAIRMSDLTRIIVQELPQQFNLRQAVLMIPSGEAKRIYPAKHPDRETIRSLAAVPDMLKNGCEYILLAPDHSEQSAAREINSLCRCGFQLVLRLQSRTAFMGMLLLGAKRSNTVYSGRDVQALTILANQVATAVENALNYQSLEWSQASLKKMFTKMVQAEKLAAIGEMTAVLAHEIKNPLGVIRSSAQFLTAQAHGREDRDELLGFIVSEVDRLTQVVNNLLGLARYAPPDFKPVELRDLLGSLLRHWNLSDEHNPRVLIRCQGLSTS